MSFEGYSRILAAGATLAVLAACGGGGGGDPGPGQGAEPLAITQANAPAVSAEALDAGGAALTGGGVLTAAEVSATPAGTTVPVMVVLADALRRAARAEAPAAMVGATFTETLPCTDGGTVTSTVQEADESIVTPGDRVDMTFDDCAEGDVISSGGLSIAFVSGDAEGTLLEADVVARRFTATRAGVGVRMDGRLRMTADFSDPPQIAVRATSGSILFDRLVDGNLRASRSLTAYTLQAATNTDTGRTSATFSYDISGTFPGLGTGAFSVQTLEPVVTPGDDVHPSAGVLRITGANDSSALVTVVIGGVRADVDGNGDGAADATLNFTWPQIDAEL